MDHHNLPVLNLKNIKRLQHKTSVTYHPAINGQIERYAQEVKRKLKSVVQEPGSVNEELIKRRMQYRENCT